MSWRENPIEELETWSAGLSEAEKAQALAGLGCFWARSEGGPELDALEELEPASPRPNDRSAVHLPWSLPDRPELGERLSSIPAHRMAELWRRAVDRHGEQGVGIEVQRGSDLPGFDQLDSLLPLLEHPDVGARCVSVHDPSLRARVSWRLPLRIAFLEDASPEGTSLRSAVDSVARYRSWWPNLVRIVPPDRDPDAVDLLVFFGSPADAAKRLGEGPQLAADLILILDPRPEPEGRRPSWSELAAAGAGARTAGIAWAPVEGGGAEQAVRAEAADRLVRFVAELSHDLPIDQALENAFGAIGPRPRLLSSSRLLREARFSTWARDWVRRQQKRIAFGGAALASRGKRFDPTTSLSSTSVDRPGTGRPDTYRAPEDDDDAYGAREAGADSSPASSAREEREEAPPSRPPSRPEWLGETAGAVEAAAEEMEEASPSDLAWLEEAAGEVETAAEEPWEEESGTASRVTRSVERAEAALAAEPPRPKPDDRFLQARVSVEEEGGVPDASGDRPKIRRRNTFLGGAVNYVDVLIAAPRPEEGYLLPPKAKEFPDEELRKLAPDVSTYPLTVVLVAPAILPEAIRRPLDLPVHGDTAEPCRFALPIPGNVEEVRAEVFVYYERRLLQSVHLLGAVRTDDDAPEGRNIRLESGFTIRRALDLGGRQSFDGSVVLTRSDDGEPQTLQVTDRAVRLRTGPSLADQRDWYGRWITSVGKNRQDYADGLTCEATLDLLRKLARHGRELWEHLVEDHHWDEALLTGERIQVISARTDVDLPLEMVYSRPAPRKDAVLCPRAAEALRDDSACAGCRPDGTGEEDPRSVICPLAFWGMSRVIERHAHDKRLAEDLDTDDFALQDEPVEHRRSLSTLTSGLVAATEKVENVRPGSLTEIHRQLEARTLKADVAETWERWEKEIEKEPRSLMLLLIHTEPVDSDDPMPKMEIGGTWLESADIERAHVVGESKGDLTPIVLLLGCETDTPKVQLHSLVQKFRRRGAGIVVSTGAKIHVDHAVPVAEAFVQALDELAPPAGEPGILSFGEVLRTVRRRMLAEGLPMVFTLAAHGDADWRLQRSV